MLDLGSLRTLCYMIESNISYINYKLLIHFTNLCKYLVKTYRQHTFLLKFFFRFEKENKKLMSRYIYSMFCTIHFEKELFFSMGINLIPIQKETLYHPILFCSHSSLPSHTLLFPFMFALFSNLSLYR